MEQAHHRIVIVGAGFSGLGMAIKLKQAGIEDFVVLERADDVGGTWRANTYPGCQCDVPSHLYSFSFAPNPDWSHTFSGQEEIWDYLRDCAQRFDVMSQIRFGCELIEAAWSEDALKWQLDTSQGAISADLVVAGMGVLVEPKLPDIPGIEDFEGAIFHTAQWDHEHDLAGERVAVVGTGASSIQVVPEIQPKVAKLHVFQRTAAWMVPHHNRTVSAFERRLYRLFPPLEQLFRGGVYALRELMLVFFMHPRLGPLMERGALRHLKQQVPDPELREKLTPSFRIGCKRLLISNDYYPALTQPNTELVTDAISEFRGSAIVTADGAEREVDAVVLGTGFRVSDWPYAEHFRGRQGELLSDVWREGPQAYAGTTVAGFPNLFMLIGPNTGLGHNSIVYMIESQISYVIDCIRKMDEQRLATVEVRPHVQEAYNDEIQKQLQGTVWNSGGCASWYLGANGRNTVIWPGPTWRFRRRLKHFDLASYATQRRTPERVTIGA
jgi:cation diffusion facilitator CzcD-associated flavoprotein CzcO